MKPLSEEMRQTSDRLRERLADLGITKAELARRSGVHPSQVGRILAGEGASISHNVLRICNALGVDPNVDAVGDMTRISQAALAIWDGTHEGADAIVGMLHQLARIKERRN